MRDWRAGEAVVVVVDVVVVIVVVVVVVVLVVVVLTVSRHFWHCSLFLLKKFFRLQCLHLVDSFLAKNSSHFLQNSGCPA